MQGLLSNGIFQAVVAALLVAVILWFVRRYMYTRDEQKIIDFLRLSAAQAGFRFRTTESIVAATHLSENRVKDVCGSSKRIARNEKEKESWRLA